MNLDKFPLNAGIATSRLSGYEDFEGLDPAEWIPRGYAIVNADSRGTNDSEGDVRFWGRAEGKDGYDTVQEIAKLPWCNGRVALAGNSWLAISQYFIAAEQPPHLACIAPFEGSSDTLRESACRGGIPQPEFASAIGSTILGRGMREDMSGMLVADPYANEYWKDKRARVDHIKVPAYLVASYSTVIHAVGTFRAFQEIPHRNKWLAVHATQEWYDLYSPERTDDLQRFFDFYTKDIVNGWPQTPRVRLSVLQFDNKPAITNLPFNQLPWLAEGAASRRLFLTAGNKLAEKRPEQVGTTSYDADATSLGSVQFRIAFPARTTIAGPTKAVLYMSTPQTDDMDVYVQLRKADETGRLLIHVNQPLEDLRASRIDEVPDLNAFKYLGPVGMLRASQRHVDESLSGPAWSTLSHSREHVQPVEPGHVVRLENWIWPTGMIFEEGEQLVLCVAGHNLSMPELKGLPPTATVNKGKHVVHFGNEYESYLELHSI
ncbi:hypothetical protein VSDG_02372 [Cytospora chrysosperma]|uniref:Xaa-Pro dipeptidyl-peptidase C-terminal domain-containing protein n=1 Tax=Cytospora chrysosperma TaxID=252740 RepID=A0A423WFK7_CYTCH|nr:hypothetical protein VSDG_02372 [Valsa sordida]